jgi:hypothetical protein
MNKWVVDDEDDNNNNEINSSSIIIYLRANLTAKKRNTRSVRVKNKQKNAILLQLIMLK